MSDSVGKISLDLEVKSDLSKQIGDVSAELGKKLESTFTNSTKGIFDGVNESIEANMKAINNVIKVALEQMQANVKASIDALMELTKGIKAPVPKINPENSTVPNTPNLITPSIPRAPPVLPQGAVIPKVPSVPNLNMEQLKAQIDNLAASLDIVNAKIEQQQEKLLGLKEAYNNTFNQDRKNKIQEQILRTEGVINKLIATSDKLGFKLSDLDEQFALLSATAGQSATGINAANSSMKNTENIANKVSRGFKLLGSSTKESGNAMRHMHYSLGMIMRQFFTWMVVLPLLMRGLTAMTTFLGQAFMTNSQFANSLAQIRSNLYTAFMPIFQAVLPAINALMAGLATITAYIASFTSTLFGKTYNQSFGAAKGLIAAKTAMGDYGEAAKKAGKDAKGALAGFDEINTLNMGKDSDVGTGAGNSKVPQMVAPNADTSALDRDTSVWANKFKSILSTIFQPFKQAWAKEGTNTINSIKYALSSVVDLIGSIGKSFATVWTNGTGEKIVSTILQILQNIFNIIGDIATTFANAWNEGNIGTSIIQGVANTILNLLTLIKKIGDSLREAWGQVGAGVAKTFMQILESTGQILDNLSSKLVYVWDNGGNHLFEGLIRLAAKIFELAGIIYANFVSPLLNWFIDLIAPVIAKIADIIGSVADAFSVAIGGINDVLTTMHDVIESVKNKVDEFKGGIEAVSIVIGALGIAILAYNANAIIAAASTGAMTIAEGAWSIASGVATVATTALGIAINFLTSPITLVILAIGSLIAAGVLLYKHWDTVKAVASSVWGEIKNIFATFIDWIGKVFTVDWSKRFGWLGDILNGFLATVRSIVSPIIQVFSGLLEFITGVFTGNWSKAWNGVKDIFGGIMGGLASVVKAPLNGVIGLVNAAISGLNKISFDLPDVVGGGHVGISIPKIPYLARGGVVDSPTLAMMGEAGKEAVMPLENNTGWINNLAGQIAAQIGGNESSISNNEILDILRQILKAVSDQNGDLIIKIGESEFARIAIAAINKRRRQTGVNELLV